LGREIASIYARTACLDETDIGFFWPEQLRESPTISQAHLAITTWLQNSRQKVDALLKQTDGVVCEAYQVNAQLFPGNDYESMEETFSPEHDATDFTKMLLSLLFGCVFGRWDARLSAGDSAPSSTDIFESLGQLSPAALHVINGQPISYPLEIGSDGIV